jgi:hypothetical protein
VFVVGDGALVDLANLIEGSVSELNALVADRPTTQRIAGVAAQSLGVVLVL